MYVSLLLPPSASRHDLHAVRAPAKSDGTPSPMPTPSAILLPVERPALLLKGFGEGLVVGCSLTELLVEDSESEMELEAPDTGFLQPDKLIDWIR